MNIYFEKIFVSYALWLIMFVPFEIILCRYYKRKGMVVSKGFVLGFQILMLYLTAVLCITGAGGMGDVAREGLSQFDLSCFTVPPFLWNPYGFGTLGRISNAVMFMPLGIMCPLLWKNGADFKKTVIIGLMLSALIEISQLFNFRTSDWDDIAMNTIGAAAGYLIFKLFLKNCGFFAIDNKREFLFSKNSPVFVTLMIFIMYFTAGQPLSEMFV